MTVFAQGQRWLVDSEPELGLGMVQSHNNRAVKLYFPESDTERQYAIKNAPLTRYLLDAGETLEHRDQGALVINKVHELNGLVIYETQESMVPETELADTVVSNSPVLRLLTGQTDHPDWFAFRSNINRGIQRIWNQQVNGLLGTRASLLPHQLYVAQQATEQTYVRVLLADEVGLGKTIETGLILNRLRHQERIQRILIAVPAALQVQWLVEMIRRFAIHCELYQHEEHDFSVGQVHLVTHAQLEQAPVMERIAQQEWDMLVLDEVHHLSKEQKSTECNWYQLAQTIPHLLLLTATPEQLGQASHFERLQLLDQDRFVSFERYQQEESHFVALSELAVSLRTAILEKQETLNSTQIEQLASLGIEWRNDPQETLNALLDRHGTGRVVYRNSRKHVAGFHERQVRHYGFEQAHEKVLALVDFLKKNPDQKVLLITQQLEDAKELAHQLWHQYGIDAGAFHEELDLIERDRAAAYFADDERGAQILVCSEIGGEGRNFQFCHHLVFWDLPDHPDMVEQRIGRLDRIGQTEMVNIHVYYVTHSEQQSRFVWYHQVLNCMGQFQPAAGLIHDRYARQWYANPDDQEMLTQIQNELRSMTAQLEQGRDLLLEMNSCRPEAAAQLKETIEQLEQNHPLALVDMAAHLLNLHFESLSHDLYELIPSSNMLIPVLPGIPEGGCLVTFDRAFAASREDVIFLSWEHPFIQGLADILNSTQLGQASLALFETNQVPEGCLLMEVQWLLQWPERHVHALRPHLAVTQFRTLMLEGGDKDLSEVLPEEALQSQLKAVPGKVSRKMIQQAKERIPPLYEACQKQAASRFEQLQQQACIELERSQIQQRERLHYLQSVNPLVNQSDLDRQAEEHLAHTQAMQKCQFLSTGVRLILCVPLGSAS